jgi:hypothetical protein
MKNHIQISKIVFTQPRPGTDLQHFEQYAQGEAFSKTNFEKYFLGFCERHHPVTQRIIQLHIDLYHYSLDTKAIN